MYRLLSLFGLFAFLAICWAISKKRSAVKWQTIAVGLVVQFGFGLLFLSWERGRAFLDSTGHGVKSFLDMSLAGSEFLFGFMAKQEVVLEHLKGMPPDVVKGGFLFAFQVLPTIIFFSAFMAVIYHLGIMSLIVKGIAWCMVRTMKTSGSESLSVASNIFVGQTEAPLLVRPFLARMTQSELMAVMTGGFATIAGGVFALYAGFGVDPGHLLVASVMSAPAALVVAKLLVPETEESETYGTVRVNLEKTSSNVVEAAATGATDGLSLALNVAAMLIAFLSLIAVANWALEGISSLFDLATPLSLQRILGWIFAPFAFLLGVEWKDIVPVGELLGYKIAVTELVAYQQLTSDSMQATLSARSTAIATYALCGFANFASIAIQIGGIAALVPERRSDLSKLGVRAMFGGAIASWMTACVAGVLLDF
ncbi:MAG: NupC/NupG family nucleoside CNT transporter [Planctomycetes bacterium]|nr:NupC/NupG family nucleoside CNT transporter [Planctomycetota bacterium]